MYMQTSVDEAEQCMQQGWHTGGAPCSKEGGKSERQLSPFIVAYQFQPEDSSASMQRMYAP